MIAQADFLELTSGRLVVSLVVLLVLLDFTLNENLFFDNLLGLFEVTEMVKKTINQKRDKMIFQNRIWWSLET